MAKKLSKEIVGKVVKITEASTKTTLEFDFSKLPQTIQDNFGPFGLGHKLGDAAAGKNGKEAVDAINKVWEGLMKGDWTIRAPKGEKINKKDVTDKLAALPEKERAIAEATLRKLGIIQ